MIALANHLWQSTAFLAAAALLSWLLRGHRAQARYAIWMAASLKFLAPFSLLVSLGEKLAWRTAPAAGGAVSYVMDEAVRPFTRVPAQVAHPAALPVGEILILAWALGGAAVMVRWAARWRRVRAVARAAEPVRSGREQSILGRIAGSVRIELVRSRSPLEPGVFGIFRPLLILPEGIAERLDDAQLEAVFAHELCHVRRRDNLAAALHMMVEALFWFHPLVWWLGTRLVEERELACDEEVLRAGRAPEPYAESVLKVCQYCLESPLPCAAGVTGADLRKRIARIMTGGAARPLGFARSAGLAMAGAAAVAGPVMLGMMSGAAAIAQPQAEQAMAFEAASIKPSKPGSGNHLSHFLAGGKYTTENVPLKGLIEIAYGLQDYQISGGPGWVDSAGYDINARPEHAATNERTRRMLQALLVERFHLGFHRESKEMAGLALTVAKGGFKLQPVKEDREGDGDFKMGYGHMDGQGASVAEFAGMVAIVRGQPVFDMTGIPGKYDWKLKWAPERLNAGAQAEQGWQRVDPVGDLFTVIQEELGLKLEAHKGPVEIFTIDHAERPTEN